MLNKRQSPSRVPWKLIGPALQRVSDSAVRLESALRLGRAEIDSLAAIVGHQVLGSNQLALQVVEQTHVIAAGADEVVNVVVQQKVAGFAGVIFAGHSCSPTRQLANFIEQQSSW